MVQAQAAAAKPPKRSRSFYDKEVQAVVWQVVFLAIVLGISYYLYSNMQANLARQNVSTGFDYLGRESGFGIGESWIQHSPAATYSRALLVGFLNTIAVAVVGVVLATIIGISIGVASLSRNWLVRQVTGVYIHLLRNIPVLLQIILWHTLITNERFLPLPRDFLAEDGPSPILGGLYLTRRGLYFPSFEPHIGWLGALAGLIIGVLVAWMIARWADRRMAETGEQFPAFWAGVGAVVARPRLELGGLAQVAGHDHQGVAEIHDAALAVGQPAVVQQLQQHVHDLGVGLLHLVQQDHAVGVAAHRLGQLAAGLEAHVARGRADHARHRVALHVLGHVQAHHVGLVAEHLLVLVDGFRKTVAVHQQQIALGELERLLLIHGVGLDPDRQSHR